MGAPIKNGKIKAKHILVKKLGVANSIYGEISRGADFGALAKKHSLCPSKKRGGDLGEFSKGKMIKEFWNACVELNKNEVSKPVKTSEGYHIIKRVR